MTGIVLLAAMGSLAIFASLHDIIARTIPNLIPTAMASTGLSLATLEGHLLGSVIASLLVFAAAVACWRRGWMGGGDVKLLAAAAASLAPAHVPSFVLAVALAGGLLAFLYLALRHVPMRPGTARPTGLLRRVLRAECWRIRRGGPLPYACAIAAGWLIVTL